MDWLEHLIATYTAGFVSNDLPHRLLKQLRWGQLQELHDHIVRNIITTERVKAMMGLPVDGNWWEETVLPEIYKEMRRRENGTVFKS